MGSTDLYATIEALAANGLGFMPAPNDIYYSRIDRRLPKHGEPLDRLKKNGILIDGEGVVEGGYTKVLLQRFSKTVIGPIFFEFIQRKGDDGFGEGNFKALFEFDRGRPDPARRPEGRGGGIAFTARSLRGACNFRVSRRSCGAIVVT